MTAALDIEGRAESEASPRRKVCSICHKELPIAAFHRRQHHVRSGIRAACRRCTAQRAKEIRDAKGKVATEDERRRNEVRRATRAAIKAGQLVAKPCEVCGTVEVEAHHPRYDGPDAHLDVKWLCRHHHALEHGVRDWTRQLELFHRSDDAPAYTFGD